MRELFIEVLDFQPQFSSENTPAMERRGQIVRREIPELLRGWKALAKSAALPFQGRTAVHGRDGTGRKTFIPWVRIYSPELSPSAQNGWYVVFLFEPDGGGVSLCISHGSTRFDGQTYVPRRSTEIAPLLSWARETIGGEALVDGFTPGVDLQTNAQLGLAYEHTTAFSKRYSRTEFPSDQEMQADLEKAVHLLGILYRQLELGLGPESQPPEIATAVEEANQISRPGAPPLSGGQGFGLTTEERKLVEMRAMMVAREWLSDNGFSHVKDTSAKASFDYTAVKDGNEFVIEVKGTTSVGEMILITAAEIAAHRERYPKNILIIVSKIELMDMRKRAIGGTIDARVGWEVDSARLEPIAYRCELDP